MISYEPPLLHGGVHGDQEQKYFFSDCDAVMKPRGRPCNKVALYKKKRAWKSLEDLQNVKQSGNSRREEPIPEDLHVNPSYAFKKSSMFDDNRDKQQQEQRGARGTNNL